MTERARKTPGRRTLLGAAVLGTAALGLPAAAQAAERGRGHGTGGHGSLRDLPVPTVIGHRGASGYRPEHTLGSYQLALDLGAHIVEQDLVPTKDGHLVCRHENDITGTTDVADHPEFAGRRTTKSIDGVSYTGWFTEDFTLAELKTLRATERIPGNRPDNTLYNGRWTVPTFEEVLRWAEKEGRKRGAPVWLYVETKHPTYFRKLGLGLEEPLARLLRRYGSGPEELPAHPPVLRARLHPAPRPARRHPAHRPAVRPHDAPLGLRRVGRPAHGRRSGEARRTEVAGLLRPGHRPHPRPGHPQDASGRLTTPTTLVRDAHAKGLLLHPYTLRNENSFLPADFRRGTDPNAYGDVFGACAAYFATGIDGIFADHPDTALLAAADHARR